MQSFPFGWEDDQDGFRGHVFVSEDLSTVVLSIKGTTLQARQPHIVVNDVQLIYPFSFQGPTSKKDKFNDNLLFSCCCARVDLSWVLSTVCDCYARNWRCDDSCLSDALIEDSLFYSIGVVSDIFTFLSFCHRDFMLQNLINNLTSFYPSSNIWLVGHSLGGALASLLGSTFGHPAVAFESPGERLAATRLHLPLPPPLSPDSSPPVPVTHVYHNADPIPQGVCTGIFSPCTHAGFALESKCHLGKSIVYDTVGRFNWQVDVRRHVIREVITKVLEAEEDWEGGRGVPEAKTEEDCFVSTVTGSRQTTMLICFCVAQDCYKWDFV